LFTWHILNWQQLPKTTGIVFLTKEGNRKDQGTDKKQKLHQFKAQSKKRCFYKMRSTKKTVSLFQPHVFKHEFFLFPVARSLFPLKFEICYVWWFYQINLSILFAVFRQDSLV
jgi:hypothetical protein